MGFRLKTSGLAYNGMRFMQRKIVNNIAWLSRGGRYAFPQLVDVLCTRQCNLRCLQCTFWANQDKNEISLDEWKAIILDIKKFAGPFFIRFYGGEPFARPDFMELIAFCFQQDIGTLITTNGTLIDEKIAKTLISRRVIQVNISLDGEKPQTHDHLRGVPGTHEKALRSIALLKDSIPVQINTTIMDDNVEELVGLAAFAEKNRVKISFQGLISLDRAGGWKIIPELAPKDLKKLDRAIDALSKFKKHSKAILTSQAQLARLKQYYHRSIPLSKKFCEMKCEHVWIKSNGDIFLCTFRNSVANASRQPVKTIWESEETRREMRDMRFCPYTHCLIMRGCYKESPGEFFEKIQRLLF